jgi:hypothetical protein
LGKRDPVLLKEENGDLLSQLSFSHPGRFEDFVGDREVHGNVILSPRQVTSRFCRLAVALVGLEEGFVKDTGLWGLLRSHP